MTGKILVQDSINLKGGRCWCEHMSVVKSPFKHTSRARKTQQKYDHRRLISVRMVRPVLRVTKQPPACILVGSVFEIEVQAIFDGHSYQLKVDDRIDAAETPKLVDSDFPSTLRCSSSKPVSDIAIEVRLVCKQGKIVATAETSPISIAYQKINVTTTKEWTSLWYKDEGGREKSIDLVASLEACEQESSSLKLCLKPVLYYASGRKGLVMVANQDILRILSDDLSLALDESRLIRFRIEDVSKNHQGQDFQIQLNVDDRPDILPGKSPHITVRSKRNKRTRVSSNTKKQPTATKTPGSRPIVASHIQKAICCVMKWSDAVAIALQSKRDDPTAARCLSEYGYIREQLDFLQVASTQENTQFQDASDSTLDLQQQLPFQWQNPKDIASSNHTPILNRIEVVDGHQRMPEPSKKSRRVESESVPYYANCSVVRDSNDHIGLVVADFMSAPAKEKGVPAFSTEGTFLGIVNKNGTLDKECGSKAEAKAYQLQGDSDQNNVFSREKYGDRLVDMAWERATKKEDSADFDAIGSKRIKLETKIEYLLGVTMKSKYTDECLGFPVFCVEKQLLGFVRERCFGEYGFVLPPASFSLSDKEEAATILGKYPLRAVFPKSKLFTLDALAHHALVYKWKNRSEGIFQYGVNDSQ